MEGRGHGFADIDEVEHALAAGVHLHARITAPAAGRRDRQASSGPVRDHGPAASSGAGSSAAERESARSSWSTVLLRKKDIQNVIDTVYRYCGQKEAVIFCDQIMALVSVRRSRAGFPFGKDDMVIPAQTSGNWSRKPAIRSRASSSTSIWTA